MAIKVTDEDEDDEPQPPYHARIQNSPLLALLIRHNQEARFASARNPPPNSTPAYIKLAVFRT
ncbi:hypothetical protein B7Z17_02130 [Candidatus Saccharibacteria bacterium 32-49-10]|nr:MAG: hypothetical protein B7Z17_02130 [Candidatus Saccharibacteria bacterium 32-49-10]